MTDEEQTTPEPAQLPMDPSQVRTATVAELGRLDAFVQGLSLDSWSKPSAVPGWTVGDVVAHLNLVLALSGRLVDAVVSGKGSGSVWRALDRVGQRVGPVAGRAFDALNTSLPRVIDRALSPEVIKGQLATSARTFGEKLARVESGDYTRPVYYRGGPWPLSFFLSAVLAELAIHGWDIASRLDPHAHLSDDARLVLPWFFWSGTPFMLRLPKAHPEGKV
ncbi:MAG: maleylpyruvate isomerase N-terminal domain-containing protein, partial [Chloroflexi bacterium]|nr:maleylpyruvate isomerase N-terminal domain-containing protein [Chloroflexota bacterium]